jgi:hypothetical protein
LRRIALDLLRADTSLKASLKGKRKAAARDNAFLHGQAAQRIDGLMRLPWVQGRLVMIHHRPRAA